VNIAAESAASAASAPGGGGGVSGGAPSAGAGLGFWLVILAAMAVLPFVLTMVTSFAKLVIVGGIVRQALGTQNIPPNTVITGLALIMTAHIMAPVAERAYANYQSQQKARGGAAGGGGGGAPGEVLEQIMSAAEPPMREFLTRHSDAQHVQLFRDLSTKLREANNAGGDAAAAAPPVNPLPAGAVAQGVEDLTILAPAFILSELTRAFLIGFLIFVPFLVIDLVVSNVLLAMGMHMLSPVTVSLPLKLLLFVVIDGWTLLLQGLALGYT
jgi:type III secretion protein R